MSVSYRQWQHCVHGAGLCSGCGVGGDHGEGRDQAGQVRDDHIMEISHSECNELLQLYDFLLWAASQFYK